jgi:hypothetical protein
VAPVASATGVVKPQEVAATVSDGEDAPMAYSRRIADEERYAHLITYSVERRRTLLDHDHPKRILFGVLN